MRRSFDGSFKAHVALEALSEERSVAEIVSAFDKYGTPEIFNTDQGSQFTSEEFICELKQRGARISMDGKGRALDNVYVKRLWCSVKYENIYLNEYRSLKELKGDVKSYFEFYNTERWHQSLEYATSDEVYFSGWDESLKRSPPKKNVA